MLGDAQDGACEVGDEVRINGERSAVVNAINTMSKDLPETKPGLSCALEPGAVNPSAIFEDDVIPR